MIPARSVVPVAAIASAAAIASSGSNPRRVIPVSTLRCTAAGGVASTMSRVAALPTTGTRPWAAMAFICPATNPDSTTMGTVIPALRNATASST
jgi:hypothetical protein